MIHPDLYPIIRKKIKAELDQASSSISDVQLQERIEQAVFSESAASFLTVDEQRSIVRRLFHTFRGLDVLQSLVEDRTISEIMVNHHQEIFVERQGAMERSEIVFENRERLEDIIQQIVGRVNRSVNEAQPIVDARLPDGSRVHVVLPPIALKGPTLTIRKFPENPPSLTDLVRWGTLTQEAADFLRKAVVSRYNIFICGGTGSGKTTLLNALASCIPDDERVITIEDSAELQLPGISNLVSLETRNANTEGKGEIRIRDLIRASLRMRPNRIIVGEVRGAEALDMLQAMNTGHEGSLSTGHSNSIRDMFNRLEMMVASGADLPIPVIRNQMVSALDLMVYVSRHRDHSRTVTEISEVIGIQGDDWKLNPLYQNTEEVDEDGRKQRFLAATGNALLRNEKWIDSAG